jgi:hypothetical protein
MQRLRPGSVYVGLRTSGCAPHHLDVPRQRRQELVPVKEDLALSLIV